MSEHQPRFVVLWCGHECAGNPHASRAAAQAWIERQYAECRAAGCEFYGDYRIEERPVAKRVRG